MSAAPGRPQASSHRSAQHADSPVDSDHNAGVCWSTSSFGGTPMASANEFAALREHLLHCRQSERRLFTLQCAAERMRGFVATRFVTTLVLVAVTTGVGSLVL